MSEEVKSVEKEEVIEEPTKEVEEAKIEEAKVEELEEKPEEEEVETPFIPEDVEIREERIYVIPLWRSWISGRGYRRAKKAMRYLRRFIARHMRNEDIKISPKVNEIVWSRGIRNPPRKIRVKVVLGSDQIVYVLPADEDAE